VLVFCVYRNTFPTNAFLFFKVLDLFSLKESGSQEADTSTSSPSTATGVSSVLQSLPELWNEAEYAEEYDITQYISNLRSNRV
jgi:hypothetical protein